MAVQNGWFDGTHIGEPCDIERDDGIAIQVRVAVAIRLDEEADDLAAAVVSCRK